MRSIDDAVQAVREGGRITFLTGAGISAESGIRTFRDSGGLWEQHPLEDVATPEGFARDPALVHRFYNARRRQVCEVAPNPAHRALAELEASLGTRFALITQNIDDLHERAGSRRVLHMHGEILRAGFRMNPSARGRANGHEARSEDEDVCGEYDESERRSIVDVQPAEARRSF